MPPQTARVQQVGTESIDLLGYQGSRRGEEVSSAFLVDEASLQIENDRRGTTGATGTNDKLVGDAHLLQSSSSSSSRSGGKRGEKRVCPWEAPLTMTQ